jgi:protein-tyrosine phosphatase
VKRLIAFLFILACRPVLAAGIEQAKVEQTGPGSYSIQLQASQDAYPIAIYFNSDPGPSESGKLAATAAHPANEPIVVNLPAESGRVYFHLKPRLGAARVVSIRRLLLTGAANFRDLGGYRTEDGRYVRWGTIYRSGQLAGLTDADYQYLAGLGLRLVCDFRIDSERQNAPTKWKGETPPELLTATVDTITYFSPSVDVRERMRVIYSRMPLDAAAEFGSILHRFQKGDLPALVHCSAGKDRTGFFSAMLLTALGVPWETVREDFLLTNKYLVPDDRIPELTKQMQARMKLDNPPDAEAVRTAMGVNAESLSISFGVIREKFGSFDAYLSEALKITPEDLKALRDRLLEK